MIAVWDEHELNEAERLRLGRLRTPYSEDHEFVAKSSTSVLTLHRTSKRRMDMQCDKKTYQVIADTTERTLDITVSQPFSGSILGLSTWSSALFLANRIHFLGDHDESVHTINGTVSAYTNGTTQHVNGNISIQEPPKLKVLEIGAGTGLAGLSAALLWHADVVLSDIAECTENLARTISFNASALASTESSIRAGTLNWREPDQLTLYHDKTRSSSEFGRFDVMLAADTVYDEHHPSMIVRVVQLWLARHGRAKLIMGYPLRIMHLSFVQELWKGLEKLGLLAVREGKVDVGEEWDDERLCEWAVWMWKDARNDESCN